MFRCTVLAFGVVVALSAVSAGGNSPQAPARNPLFETVVIEGLSPAELRDNRKWQLDPNLTPEQRKGRLAEIDKMWSQPGYRNEGSCVFDVNKDGKLDIVAGDSWYEGPDFKKKHPVRDLPQEGEFCRNYGQFPYDLNGDGWVDFVTGSWMSRDIEWYENPGPDAKWQTKWKKHLIHTSSAFLEGLVMVDLDGDGQLDILPNTHQNGKAPVFFLKVVAGKSGQPPQFTVKDVGPTGGGHGVGAGDLNGDGRPDIICAAGWYEAPADPLGGKWTWRFEQNPTDPKAPWLGMAGLPIQVFDVNGDKLPDIVYGQGHDFGNAWLEQKRDPTGKITWIHHPIDRDWSQAHTWTPVKNLLGKDEVGFVTGKRIRGHRSADPGSLEPRCVFYYVHNPQKPGFDRVILTWDEDVSTGMNINVLDIDGDGDQDIVMAGKSGLYLLRNKLK